jgi:hypothetical protein
LQCRRVGEQQFALIAGNADRIAVECARIVYDQREARGIAREHRLHAAGGDAQAREVAKRVQDAVDPKCREQEGQDEAQAQVVIDRAAEHQSQRCDEQQAMAGRQDEYPSLHQHDAGGLRAVKLKEPAIGARAQRAVGSGQKNVGRREA